MDPFYNDRRFYYQPGLNRYYYPYNVPVHHQPDSARQTDRHAQPKQGPKVVQIPIHFVGSKDQDWLGSALKIQKVFRGFLVRKCVKKISEIETQVDEIEAKLARNDVVELVRSDEKERLRMIEGLMSLLFKLDSIKGYDFGVRAYRKAVTRRVIALQERIDSIVAASFGSNQEDAEAEDDDEIARDLAELNGNREGNEEIGGVIEGGRSESEDGWGKSEDCSENSHGIDSNGTCEDKNEIEFSTRRCSADSTNPDVCVQAGDTEEIKTDEEKREGEGIIDVEVERASEAADVSEDQKQESESNSNKKRNHELERIMEDNEKMMKMLAQLCERNESQSKMLTALAHRVELLEKVFVCEKLRKIKKNNKTKNACAATC